MNETGISLKLRMAADSLHITPRPTADVIALLREAADEADRFNEGMRAWKQTAETKDAKLSAEMTDRINERVAARLAAAPVAPAEPSPFPNEHRGFWDKDAAPVAQQEPPTEKQIEAAIWHLKGSHEDFALARRLIRRIYEGEMPSAAPVAAPAEQGEPSDTNRLDWLAKNEYQIWEVNNRYSVRSVTEAHPVSQEHSSARSAIDAMMK